MQNQLRSLPCWTRAIRIINGRNRIFIVTASLSSIIIITIVVVTITIIIIIVMTIMMIMMLMITQR